MGSIVSISVLVVMELLVPPTTNTTQSSSSRLVIISLVSLLLLFQARDGGDDNNILLSLIPYLMVLTSLLNTGVPILAFRVSAAVVHPYEIHDFSRHVSFVAPLLFGLSLVQELDDWKAGVIT
jgi:hypothetical protein